MGLKQQSDRIDITGLLRQLLLVGGACLGGFALTIIAAAITGSILGPSSRATLLIVSAIQGILLFALPAFLAGYLTDKSHPLRLLGANRGVTLISASAAIFAFLLGLPALNQIIDYNANIVVPWPELESLLRKWEESAASGTEILLNTESCGGLISGILVIGVITGFCEEIFFRGCLQRSLTYFKVNPHIAIWTAALLFSAAHFQFYGFLPRLLLGAFFGYLLYWSQSIWLPVICHSLNNSLVVIFTWLSRRGFLTVDVEKFGVSDSFPWVGLFSAIVCLVILYYGRNTVFVPEKK